MRQADVYLYDRLAGRLTEDENGYTFQYDAEYLDSAPIRISVNFPLRKEAFHDKILFPFFDGLIPEGWLLDVVVRNWKINPSDRFGILLVACKDSIGNISIQEVCDDL